MTCRFLARALSFCIAISATAQTKPLTVQAIFNDPSFTADAPQGMEWSPDGLRMTYLNPNGDLMAVDSSGQTSVLVAKEKIGSMHSKTASEQDKDHRNRYNEASYLWAPDSKNLLFDSNGALFLYSLKDGVGLAVAETGTASGDDPKFAPDGSAVTYVRDHDLYLRRLPNTQQAVRLTKSTGPATQDGEVDWLYLEELDVRSNYFWSPDSKNIAFLQMNEAAVPQYPITDWIPVHATVELHRILDGAFPASVQTLRLYTGYLGAAFGYLPTAKQVTEGGYEVNGFQSLFGLSGRFEPGRIEPAVCECLKSALDELERANTE